MLNNKTLRNGPAAAVGLIGVVAFFCGMQMLYAGTETVIDLSDNEICLGCHVNEEQLGTIEAAGARIHDPADGSILVEVHTMVACINCHLDIEEIPHREAVVRTVDCLSCHDTTPE